MWRNGDQEEEPSLPIRSGAERPDLGVLLWSGLNCWFSSPRGGRREVGHLPCLLKVLGGVIRSGNSNHAPGRSGRGPARPRRGTCPRVNDPLTNGCNGNVDLLHTRSIAHPRPVRSWLLLRRRTFRCVAD